MDRKAKTFEEDNDKDDNFIVIVPKNTEQE